MSRREPVEQKFHVQGNKIQLRAVVRGPQFDVEDLFIEGQAAIDETRTPELPIWIDWRTRAFALLIFMLANRSARRRGRH